jgi:hypothetical protein
LIWNLRTPAQPMTPPLRVIGALANEATGSHYLRGETMPRA